MREKRVYPLLAAAQALSTGEAAQTKEARVNIRTSQHDMDALLAYITSRDAAEFGPKMFAK